MSSLTKTTAIAAILAAALAVIPTNAAAQGRVCAERDKIVERLEATHGEVRQSFGLQRNAGVIETYANPDTGSWTIIVSLPTGLSCLVAVGEAYQSDPKKVSLVDPGA
ncbi:MAG: hypothetical protein AAF401_12400 [Pseudomonadota bacterium]